MWIYLKCCFYPVGYKRKERRRRGERMKSEVSGRYMRSWRGKWAVVWLDMTKIHSEHLQNSWRINKTLLKRKVQLYYRGSSPPASAPHFLLLCSRPAMNTRIFPRSLTADWIPSPNPFCNCYVIYRPKVKQRIKVDGEFRDEKGKKSHMSYPQPCEILPFSSHS